MDSNEILKEAIKLVCSQFDLSSAQVRIVREYEGEGSVVFSGSVDISADRLAAETVREKAVEQGILFRHEDWLSEPGVESDLNYMASSGIGEGVMIDRWKLSCNNGCIFLSEESYRIELRFPGNPAVPDWRNGGSGPIARTLEIIRGIIPQVELERIADRSYADTGCPGGSARFDPPYIGCSEKVRQLKDRLVRVAGSSIPVLIEGESGTGKEIVARNIHRFSRRADGPLINVNCAAIQPTLLRAELFGFRRGSFTGAVEDRAGMVENASGGTLFLDEIAEMPSELQAAMLRVIQEGEVRRVGESGVRAVDVRFVFATNRDVEHLVSSGSFRKDLFFRICGIRLRTDPLRERRNDILPLFLHFLRKSATGEGIPVPRLSSSASETITSYLWPGNVRELINEVDRIVALYRGCSIITSRMLSPRIRGVGGSAGCSGNLSLQEAVSELERKMLSRALARYNGNRTRSARSLGISRQGLLNKVKRYGLEECPAVPPGD